MKKQFRAIAATAIASIAALTLTACDPPMPPDVAAQIAEQTYTCVEGDVSMSVPLEFADPASQWQAVLPEDCIAPLPEMTLTVTEANTASDLLVSSYAPTPDVCKAFSSVPLGVESANIAFSLSITSTLNLSPKTAAAILNGQITNWNDKAIADENIGTEFPDQPIKVHTQADRLAFESLNEWFSREGASISSSSIAHASQASIDDVAVLEEGEIAIVPGSFATSIGLFSATIQTGFNKETQEQILATPDVSGTGSATTQWVAKEDSGSVSVKLDPSVAPVAQAGFDDAATPYQAIYPLNLYLCGEDTLLKRAMATFVLRLDSQGALGASNYNQLNEGARTLALVTVRKGLPEPKAP